MVGALFTGVTLMLNDCVAVSVPSLTSTVTFSFHAVAPPSPGSQSITPLIGSMVMPAGAVVSDQLSVSPSLSSPVTVYWYAWPSVALVMAVDVMVGASLTLSTVTLTVMSSLSVPSLTRTTKLSLPT